MHKFTFFAAALLAACALAFPAYAGAPGVEISRIAYDPVSRTASITVEVVHPGVTAAHHVEWLSIRANGSEVKRIEFSALSLPEGETFERTVMAGVFAPLTIEAEAACARDGSRGAARLVFTADAAPATKQNYGEVKTYLGEISAVYESFITGISTAESAADVAAAINAFTSGMVPLIAKGKDLERKYPELKLKDSRSTPAELAEEMKKFEDLTRRFMTKSVMDKMVKYASDPLVQKAQKDMNEKLKGL